ncbi:hypothetical protein GGI22_004378, partial [Coemansia erecta]
QRKKRRKKNDGNNTETEGQPSAASAQPNTEDPSGETDSPTGGPGTSSANPTDGAALANGRNDPPGATLLDDLDKYEEDDFFVYYGPLNELQSENEDEQFEKADQTKRSRKRPEKKPPSKDAAPAKRKPNGAVAPSKGSDAAEAPASKKKIDGKPQHRRSSSESGTAANVAQIPTNGRKSGARTSRKLEASKATSMIEHPTISAAAPAGNAAGTDDDIRKGRPPIPSHDRPAATTANSVNGNKEGYLDQSLSEQDSPNAKQNFRRNGTPSATGIVASSTSITAEDALAISKARETTPEIDAALEELVQATKGEAFENRQRFPSALKPPLRQVCELSMARALEYERSILSLRTPEHKIFAWSTPLDIVGFTAGIYHRLADILPYNRATVRKIVSKLLSHDLLTWKERQLKQIEEGLKARIDEQIERGMGWIPVGARTGTKESEDAASGGAQVRWHWTTISKHLLYQYIVLTLSINGLRNHLDQGVGKDGAYREQQARKDAYAHLVNLWPGSTMVTYEISRAYSSRKALVEKQNKKADAPTKNEAYPTTVQRAHSHSTLEATPAPPAQPDQPDQPGFVADAGENAQLLQSPEVTAPMHSPHTTPVVSRYDNGVSQPNHNVSPYLQNPALSPPEQQQKQHHISSPTRTDYIHSSQRYDNQSQVPEPPVQVYDGGGAARMPMHQPSPHHNHPAFGPQPDQFVHPSGYAHPGSAHTSPYYGGNAQPMGPHEGRQLQFQTQPQAQPHHHQHHMSNGSNKDASNEERYNSPDSSRYSMSVHNLTTP